MREMTTLNGLDIGSHIAWRAGGEVFSGVLVRVEHQERHQVFLSITSGPWRHTGHYAPEQMCIVASDLGSVSRALAALPSA